MARLRKFLIGLILLVVVLIVAAVVAAPLLPLTALEPAVERRLSDLLGRKVAIDSMRLNLTGGPYLTITGMTAQEDAAFGEGEFLRADSVRADIDVIEYLRYRRIAIEEISIDSAQIHLVRNDQGSWNWTTLGKQLSETAEVTFSVSKAIDNFALAALLPADFYPSSLRKIRIDNASVRLTDRKSASPDTLYKNISLDASLEPISTESSESASQARGHFTAQSEGDGETGILKATFPFDLKIERGSDAALAVEGAIGPGPLETRNLNVASFSLSGQILARRDAPLAGNGRLSATGMFIESINLSERLATALRINQIGDMNPGTLVRELESDFNISEGTVETTGLVIREIDGLGDATAQNGRFKINSGLSVNYPVTITLSADATSRLKSAGTMLGIITTVFEVNNRISVPVNIDGDMRSPNIYVDVSRIF